MSLAVALLDEVGPGAAAASKTVAVHPATGQARQYAPALGKRNEDTKAAPHGRNDAATHTHLRTSPPCPLAAAAISACISAEASPR